MLATPLAWQYLIPALYAQVGTGTPWGKEADVAGIRRRRGGDDEEVSVWLRRCWICMYLLGMGT